jgi:hypothetical protein
VRIFLRRDRDQPGAQDPGRQIEIGGLPHRRDRSRTMKTELDRQALPTRTASVRNLGFDFRKPVLCSCYRLLSRGNLQSIKRREPLGWKSTRPSSPRWQSQFRHWPLKIVTSPTMRRTTHKGNLAIAGNLIAPGAGPSRASMCPPINPCGWWYALQDGRTLLPVRQQT